MTEPLPTRMASAFESNDAAALVALGCELSDTGDHINAAGCFRAALDLGAERVAFNLANELVDLDRGNAAIGMYERAIAAGEADAYLNLGQVLEDAGDPACRQFDRTQDPQLEDRLRAGDDLYPSARADLAGLLRRSGRRDDAVAVLRRGTEFGESDSLLRTPLPAGPRPRGPSPLPPRSSDRRSARHPRTPRVGTRHGRLTT